MLSPDVNQVKDQLARAATTIVRVDAFAYAAINSTIGRLSPEPAWLPLIRDELVLLNAAGVKWQQTKAELWAPILSQLPSYYTLVAGVAEVAKDLGSDTESWSHILASLSEALQRAELATKTAELRFKVEVNNLNNIQQVFSTSIDKAWAALASEEKQMSAMAEQIGALNEQLGALQGELSADGISGGKTYVQSTLSMTYKLATAAESSIPYLGIISLAFTIGKELYDVFATSNKIYATIDKISELSVGMSEHAQAAAMSKALIHLITGFDVSLAAVGRQLPLLSAMWSAERAKVQSAIHALQAGADPKSHLDLIALRPAVATWKTLSDFVAKLLATPAMGRPVLLSTAPFSPPLSPSTLKSI